MPNDMSVPYRDSAASTLELDMAIAQGGERSIGSVSKFKSDNSSATQQQQQQQEYRSSSSSSSRTQGGYARAVNVNCMYAVHSIGVSICSACQLYTTLCSIAPASPAFTLSIVLSQAQDASNQQHACCMVWVQVAKVIFDKASVCSHHLCLYITAWSALWIESLCHLKASDTPPQPCICLQSSSDAQQI
eukprot:15467-Heterococcus_DN1.PRE.2